MPYYKRCYILTYDTGDWLNAIQPAEAIVWAYLTDSNIPQVLVEPLGMAIYQIYSTESLSEVRYRNALPHTEDLFNLKNIRQVSWDYLQKMLQESLK